MLVGVYRMSKRGQTLVLFIIFIPIFIGLAALVIDTGLVISKKVQLKETTKTIIKEYFNKNLNENEINDLMVKNDVDVGNLVIEIEDNKIALNNETKIDSIFGGLIGIKNYKIKIQVTGYKENDKVIVE